MIISQNSYQNLGELDSEKLKNLANFFENPIERNMVKTFSVNVDRGFLQSLIVDQLGFSVSLSDYTNKVSIYCTPKTARLATYVCNVLAKKVG